MKSRLERTGEMRVKAETQVDNLGVKKSMEVIFKMRIFKRSRERQKGKPRGERVTGIRQRSVERKSVWTDAFERAKGEEVERTGREGVDNV